MASGDTLATWTADGQEPPTTVFASWTVVNAQPILEYDAATDEYVFLSGILASAYSGGGVTVTLIWTSASATSGDCFWSIQIERQAVGHSILTNNFAGSQSNTATAPGAAGELVYSTVAFTNGAQMDSLAVGERFRLYVSRQGSSGSDTMTGDARLVAVLLSET